MRHVLAKVSFLFVNSVLKGVCEVVRYSTSEVGRTRHRRRTIDHLPNYIFSALSLIFTYEALVRHGAR